MTIKIILLRHGITQYNIEKKFTGWTNVPLAPAGEEEARRAGELIKKSGIEIDEAYSSVLERSEETMKIVLKVLGKENIPQFFSWRLNERHYGALQGHNHQEIIEKFGKEKFDLWHRSFRERPPLLSPNDPTAPKNQEKYKDIPENELPLSESLEDTEKRTMPLWNSEIMPKIKQGKNILIVLSGNSCRAVVKNLNNISDEQIPELNIPTGEPLIYEFDENGNEIKHYYLSSDEEIQAKIESLK